MAQLQQQIPRHTNADCWETGEDQCAKQSVLARICQDRAGERKSHRPRKCENSEPTAVESLIDQHRQGVATAFMPAPREEKHRRNTPAYGSITVRSRHR